MSFTSPLWLIGLLPWMAVTIWLLTGRRERTQVPFLHLWKGPNAAPPRARPTIERPPLPIVCAIAAMLLAIVGAARPQLKLAQGANDVPHIPASRPSPSNIEIVSASASVSPRPQVMVRLRNDSDAASASLKVVSAGHEAVAKVDLPPRGMERNYFVDLDTVDASISIELGSDHRATLSLVHSPPSIESRGDLSQEVQRIIAAYGKLKPAIPGAARIIVAADAIPPEQSAVILGSTDLSQNAPALGVTDHPINTHVDWPAVLKQDIRISSATATGSGWQTILSVSDHPAVAIRQSPARQVWVGFTSDSWPRTSDFVIFWTNVFDWIGQTQNESQYVLQKISAVPTPTTWQASLDSVPAQLSVRDITPAFLIGAVAIIFVAAMAWATCKNCASG